MSWVSVSPVMKMTGTCASVLLRLRRRQVSKPSMPGISASMRMTSGMTFSTMESACSPSRATRTVMPAASIASVSKRRVSGESSTTSTMLRVVSFLRMAFTNLAVTDPHQRGRIALEVERIHDRAHAANEGGIFRRAAFDLAQPLLDAPDMPDLAQADQLVDGVAGRRRAFRRRRLRNRLRLVGPFDIEQGVDFLQQLAQVDRLHHAVVVEATGVQHVVRIDGIGRQHDNRDPFARAAAKPLCDLPSIHLGHRDVEQDEVR